MGPSYSLLTSTTATTTPAATTATTTTPLNTWEPPQKLYLETHVALIKSNGSPPLWLWNILFTRTTLSTTTTATTAILTASPRIEPWSYGTRLLRRFQWSADLNTPLGNCRDTLLEEETWVFWGGGVFLKEEQTCFWRMRYGYLLHWFE